MKVASVSSVYYRPQCRKGALKQHSAGVALPIEVLKRGVRKKIAQEEYSIKETELRQAEHNYKLQIMQAYFDILYAKSVYNIQEERLKLFKNLVKITTDKPKYPAYEIDNLKADIQYAQQLIDVNRAKAALLAKQFEMNKILNTGKDDVMYDTKEPSLLGHWAFMEIKIPEYEFLENVALPPVLFLAAVAVTLPLL